MASDADRSWPGDFESIALRFRCLSDATRLKILYVLSRGARTVTELTVEVECTQPNMSRHLQTLLREGIVSRERRGTHVYYAVCDESVYELCSLVCGGIERQLSDKMRAFSGATRPANQNSDSE